MRTVFLCSLLLSSILTAQQSSLPLPDSIGGWTKSDPVAIYSGTDLFKLIDGGADIFLEYGFKKVAVQRYSDRNENSIDIEIYEMEDSSSAYGIFSLFTLNTGTRIASLNEAFSGAEFLLIRKGQYYISITGTNSLKETQEGISLLGKSIDASITAAGKPPLVTAFDRAENIKMVFLKGNLALMNASRLSFGQDFKIEDGIRYEQGTGTVFIFRYAHERECQNNYAACIRDLNDGAACKHQRLKNFIVLVFSKNSSERNRAMKNITAVLKEQF